MDALQLSPVTAIPPQDVTTPTLNKDKQSVIDVTRVMDALENGATLRDAARLVGVSHVTAWRWLRQYEGSQESVAKYLSIRALDRVEDWEKASAAAATKGDHRPAKDWLLHAKAIEPVNDGSQGRTNIAIIIGTPEQPINISPPQVIDK